MRQKWITSIAIIYSYLIELQIIYVVRILILQGVINE